MGSPHVSLKHQPDKVERYWANTNYGNHLAIKRWAKWPLSEPVWAVIPHGIFYEDSDRTYNGKLIPAVFPGEADTPLPAVLNYPEHRDEPWSKHKFVVPCSAPFLYALELYKHNPVRRGTVVMPQHTTTLYDIQFDWWAFADSLSELPKPVTVLMYYNDVQRGDDKYFRQIVKCCGHVNDPRFLEKLVWYLTGAEWVVSNEVGSYTQYATAAGAKFRLIGEPPRFIVNDLGYDQGFQDTFFDSEDRHPEEQRRVAEIDELFRDRPFDEPITLEQKDCADYYLRRSAFKSPEGLHSDLELCRSLRGRHPEKE